LGGLWQTLSTTLAMVPSLPTLIQEMNRPEVSTGRESFEREVQLD